MISNDNNLKLQILKLEEDNVKIRAELVIANNELIFEAGEKVKRATELIIANKELVFQVSEKAKRAEELIIANNELVFQASEKANRAAELIIANKELVFQVLEKAKRAEELAIAGLHREELEKMNRFMVNREVKMVELKKEIEELKGKFADSAKV